MEQNNPDSLFGLHVDIESASHFRQASKWASFIAIVYFIGILIAGLVFALSGATILESLLTYFPGLQIVGSVLAVFIIIGAVIGIAMTVLLYRFASLTKRAIAVQSQEMFNEGLKSLKYYLLINGILALLGLLFTIVTSVMEVVS